MQDTAYRAPRASAIVVGILLFVVLILIICSLSEVTKTAGSLFLFLPAKMGWIPDVERSDALTIDLKSPAQVVTFSKPGPYAVYTIDYDLLVISDQLAKSTGNPWVSVTRESTGEAIKIGYVQRGLIPFDSPLVKGRPVFTFAIDQPGKYKVDYIHRPAEIGIVPDVTAGREGLLWFLLALQAAVLSLPVVLLLGRSARIRRERVTAVQQLKHIRGDDFWQSEIEKRKKKNPYR